MADVHDIVLCKVHHGGYVDLVVGCVLLVEVYGDLWLKVLWSFLIARGIARF